MKIAKLLGCCSLVSFFLIPFLGGNHLSLYYITIDRFWIETTFILFLIVAVLVNVVNEKIRSIYGFIRFLVFFLPFAAVSAIGISYTWNKFSTVNDLNVLSWVVGTVYLFSITEKKEALFKALLAGAVLSVLCMIVQSYLLFPNLFESSLTGRDALALSERVVPFSSFISESPLGGFFATLFPIALYFTLLKKNIPFVIISLFILFGLLFSMSRIAIIISLIYLGIIAILFIKKKLDISSKSVESTVQNKRKVLILIFIAISTCVLLVFFLYGVGGGIKQGKSTSRIHERMMDRIKDFPKHLSTLDARTSLWEKGIDAFAAKPLIGCGPGTYDNAYRKFYSGGLYSQYAHSSILKIVVETGVVGLMSFLFYLYGVTLGLRRLLIDRGIYIFLTISVVSSFVFSIFNISFEVPSYLVIFFVLTSVFIIDVGKNKLKNANKPVSYIVFGLIVVLLASSFFFTSRAGLADKSIQNGIAGEENSFLFEAYNSYHEAIHTMPIRNDSYIRAATTLIRLHSIETDNDKKTKLRSHLYTYANALENIKDKDSELMFATGIIYSVLGNTDKAGRYLEMARFYYPASAYYAFETSKFYYNSTQIKKAETTIRSIDVYMPQYLNKGYVMHGLYIHKIRDLESLIESYKGNYENALKIAKSNLEDAENDKYSITRSRAREYVTKEQLIFYLKNRVYHYESLPKQRK